MNYRVLMLSAIVVLVAAVSVSRATDWDESGCDSLVGDRYLTYAHGLLISLRGDFTTDQVDSFASANELQPLIRFRQSNFWLFRVDTLFHGPERCLCTLADSLREQNKDLVHYADPLRLYDNDYIHSDELVIRFKREISDTEADSIVFISNFIVVRKMGRDIICTANRNKIPWSVRAEDLIDDIVAAHGSAIETIYVNGYGYFDWNEDIRQQLVNVSKTETTPASQRIRCYPNPFNPSVTITCESSSAGSAYLRIYNTTGQLVRTYAIASADRVHRVVWNGRNSTGKPVSAGTYIIRYTRGDTYLVQRVVMAK